MPRKKLQLTTPEDDILKLKKALRVGSPLPIALESAGISKTTYFYWVAMYSIVEEIKSQDELEQMRATACGISIDEIKSLAAANSPTKKSALGAFIEPSAESLIKYRNDRQFRCFADQCYNIIKECNEARAEAALGHVGSIVKSVTDKRVNASGSMWFLERTFSDYFSKPSEKVKEAEVEKPQVEKVQVEFVDGDTKDNKDRIKAMEEQILSEQKGVESA